MNLRSDNASPVHPQIRRAIIDDLEGAPSDAGGLGYDARLDAELDAAFAGLFGRRVVSCTTATGTGANAVAIAALADGRGGGTVVCQEAAHVRNWEEDAVLRLGRFAGFIPVGGDDGKMEPSALADALRGSTGGGVLTLTNPTELGVLYTLSEMAEIAALARISGFRVHLDGARFGNCLVGLDISAGDLLGATGVDAMSFGGTKAGAFAADAVVLFQPDANAAALLERLQRAGGQKQAKRRVTQVQLLALLKDDLWLELARQQNTLCAAFVEAASVDLTRLIRHPPQVNQLFLSGSAALVAALRDLEVGFTQWDPDTLRLVFGYEHDEAAVRRVAAAISERLA